MQTTIQAGKGRVIVGHTDSDISGRRISLSQYFGESQHYVSLTAQEAKRLGEALLQHARAPVQRIALAPSDHALAEIFAGPHPFVPVSQEVRP